jgi:hypothetical protein
MDVTVRNSRNLFIPEVSRVQSCVPGDFTCCYWPVATVSGSLKALHAAVFHETAKPS